MFKLFFMPFMFVYFFYILWPTSVCERVERIVYPVDFVYDFISAQLSDKDEPVKKLVWHKNLLARLLNNTDYNTMCSRDPVLLLEEQGALTKIGILKYPVEISHKKITLVETKQPISTAAATIVPEQQQSIDDNGKKFHFSYSSILIVIFLVLFAVIYLSKDNSLTATFSVIYTFVFKYIKKIMHAFQPDSVVKPRMRIRRTDITDDA